MPDSPGKVAALERLCETSQRSDSTTLIYLAPIDEKHKSTADRARWVNFAILLYNHDIETGYFLLDAYMPSEAILNLETTTDP